MSCIDYRPKIAVNMGFEPLKPEVLQEHLLSSGLPCKLHRAGCGEGLPVSLLGGFFGDLLL